MTEQRVIFLLLPDVHLLDLAGPAQVFHTATRLGASYQLLFCAHQEALLSAQDPTTAQYWCRESRSCISN